jgi:hypothetical protein
MTNKGGREFLRRGVRVSRRPLAALIVSALGAALAGLVTTVCVTCISLTTPPFVNFKGAFSVLLFGLLIGVPGYLPVTLSRSLPVYALVWLPLWLARHRCSFFWRWRIAPLAGGSLTFVSWLITNRISPLFPDGYKHEELITASYVGAAASGLCMFAVGCRWPFTWKHMPAPVPPVLPTEVTVK